MIITIFLWSKNETIMRAKILIILIYIGYGVYGQDSLAVEPIKLRTQIFSLSPISKKVSVVNGIVLGVGHFDNKNIKTQIINGVNLEASPLCLLAPMLPFIAWGNRGDNCHFAENYEGSRLVKVSGINISLGGFTTRAQMNGINISTLTQMEILNGISLSVFAIDCKKTKGISIAGFYNYNREINGISVGIVNNTAFLEGIQLGLLNTCTTRMEGVQIGLLNMSGKTKGLQIGLLNINKKRALPFINF